MAGNGHHSCEGDHDHHESPEMGIQYSLYSKIDTGNLECLNERIEGSGRTVFKAWEERLDFEKYVESDVDEELLFNIPFTGNIKLKGVVVIGGEGGAHPSRMKLVVKFSSVTHLSIHFPRNFGSDTTKIYYIGLRGEFTPVHRHGVTICTYEARPNVADHKTDLLENMTHEVQ
ncbi:PITH domain-containing protein GA19395 isoform X2 [Anabrus simplex]|uniref:PITH domain-containing protein GA19395 isoform X2 n=1 Tax=Anabrus simplex TaxID=316456 RepID=UPI0035A3BBCF